MMKGSSSLSVSRSLRVRSPEVMIYSSLISFPVLLPRVSERVSDRWMVQSDL